MVRFRWFFIRHTESEANVQERWRIAGRSEAARLTLRGESQARLLGEGLARRLQELFDQERKDDTGRRRRVLAPVAFTSPLQRARQTAQLALAQVSWPLQLELVDDLAEIHQGLWEDALRSEVYTPETLQAMERNPYEFRAPGGEAQVDVERRVLRAIVSMIQHVERLGQWAPEATEAVDVVVLVFTHGYVCKCLVRSILEASPHFTGQIQVDNGALVELWLEPQLLHETLTKASALGSWTVIRINDTWGPLPQSVI
jgi:probable phosphoglycerate mutase